MSALNTTEIEKLSRMYEGDKARDASSNIRGFLFQDYVTIMSLLRGGAQYVCTEYLEDVDVFLDDGRFEFIQVKYYPKTTPKMKEIATDLYYQYLRLRMLRSTLTPVPALYIHGAKPVGKPTSDDMREYMGFEREEPKKSAKADEPPKEKLRQDVPDPADPAEWLRTNIHSLKKKEEQKKALFANMASKKTLDDFVGQLTIVPQPDITAYKEELMDALAAAYPDPDPENDDEFRPLILLGLAVSYIQRRYIMNDPDFYEMRVSRAEFDQYIQDSTRTKTEESIANYLVACVSEEYEDILNYNELSDFRIGLMNRIYQNTVQWIIELGNDPDGQYRLLNTFSTDDSRKIAGFRSKSIDGKMRCIAECRRDFGVFLRYLWKIMLNLSQAQIKDTEMIDQTSPLLDPRSYIVSSVTDYVCLKFPEDKYVDHSVILPRAGRDFRRVKRKIVERMVKASPLPRKWFFENDSLAPGKNYFYFSTADVNEEPTVADLERDCFYIECMKCIHIEDGDWNMQDPCGNCIFSEKCVEEEAQQ